MIVTRNWLNEWIDISGISTEKLLKTLNSIGLEVDSHSKIEIPKKVVLGFVKSKKAHENSDHLSVCEVDVGSEVLQIVCGAKNVAAGQFVAVSLVGAVLPNGLEIKPAKLRGVESHGMICSASELGLPKLNDGIMVLDSSIGELILGKEICEFDVFKDEIIEVDLTPNRSDCLSVRGVARDLSAAFDLPLHDKKNDEESDGLLGIGRLLSLHADDKICGKFAYKAFEIKDEFKFDFVRTLRLAFADILSANSCLNLLNYATHSTGVLLRAYDFDKLRKENEKISLKISQEQHGNYGIYCENSQISLAGISQNDEFKIGNDTKIVLVEANYTNPNLIATATGEDKSLKGDDHLYKAVRGSEPNLSLGLDLIYRILSKYGGVSLYAGKQQINPQTEPQIVSFTNSEICKKAGMQIATTDIVKILKRLGFEISVDGELINAKVPEFRHDIANSQDICEEIVRIVGIDNIEAKPLEFTESNRLNQTYFDYKNARNLRQKAVDNGFFECVHYVFDDKVMLSKFGFEPCKIEILNPINNELNALRPSLINHLLESAERNAKNSRKAIKLFELGSVFDADGTQSQKLAFIASGLKNEQSLLNSAKPASVDFICFANLIQNVIGKFSCEVPSEKLPFLSEFEQANIMQNGVKVGFIGRVDSSFEAMRDLAKTYICEIDVSALKFEKIEARAYSKFPSISRDLSLVVP
ncbi:MAG: phenylalanine--tRNA ligase subunit beta, partial [Campylobacter sp.]|nr:phenylalanine--tRNA ligase subunit beta [Campylobacter sp.]